MHANPSPRLVMLYQRAVICRMFPAYRLEDLEHISLVPLLRAIQLLNVADKVRNG